MPEPLEQQYFKWLCAKVLEKPDGPDYYDLLAILHRTEFIPLLPGDFNRAEEGLDVRGEFLQLAHFHHDDNVDWSHIGCSILEMFIGFAKRAEWQTSSPIRQWFWTIMTNLKLEGLRRITPPDDVKYVEDILYNLVWRLYEDTGDGGMFPMRQSEYDQRTVEIWYQFSEYVIENAII